MSKTDRMETDIVTRQRGPNLTMGLLHRFPPSRDAFTLILKLRLFCLSDFGELGGCV